MTYQVITVWERFYPATDKVEAHWEFNHVELAEVPVEQTHPLPKHPDFTLQAKEFASGTWQHYKRVRYSDGRVL